MAGARRDGTIQMWDVRNTCTSIGTFTRACPNNQRVGFCLFADSRGFVHEHHTHNSTTRAHEHNTHTSTDVHEHHTARAPRVCTSSMPACTKHACKNTTSRVCTST